MPTLDWIGKKAVLNHHKEVPYHLLKCDAKRSVGDPGSGNLLVQGDNLLALKALLPYYAGQVKCIYIDPPYNTGNEKWVYNDNVNSPEIRKWLGKVVGAEAEDLSRHAKWLCMMYPRLQLLRDFLREDGAIFISIDDHEIQNLRLILDEIFGQRNFIATIIWQKIFSTKNTAKHLSESHDYICLYAKNTNIWMPNLIPRSAKQDARYKNPDNDPRGPWTSGDLSARNFYGEGTYSITCPAGRIIKGPPKGMYWRVSKKNFQKLDSERKIWWGKNGNNVPRLKRFLTDVKQGLVPDTIWFHAEVGNTQEAKKDLLSICEFDDNSSVFITPKPIRLIKQILQIATDKDSIVLDSFAGSGTTGHAVMEMNKEDQGNRRFVMVEIEDEVCRNVTAQRIERVCKNNESDCEDDGFRYCGLGEPLFDESGQICKRVNYNDLARHIFFTETGEPLPKEVRGRRSPLIGVHKETAYYLLFNGIIGDKSVNGGNVLTGKVLETLPKHNGPKVVFGEGCRLGKARLKRERITFKQIPYEIKVS
jgi:adenine-specific DNA-methyltransferase